MTRGDSAQPAWMFGPPSDPALVPANSDYVDRFHTSFGSQRMMRLLGVEADHVEPGSVRLRVDYRDDLTQQHGRLHGGLIGAMLDTSCGFAALTLFPPGTAVLTVEYKVNFMRAAVGTRAVTRGQVIKPGKTLTVCVGEAHAIADDGATQLVATSQQTMTMLPAGSGIAEG